MDTNKSYISTNNNNKVSNKITNKTPFNNSDSPNSSYSDISLDSDKNLSTETNVSGATDNEKSVLQFKLSLFSCCK
jgi:hypothetical protein